MSDPGAGEDALRRYVESHFATDDTILKDLRADLERHGFPLIQVSAATGRALQVLIRSIGARRVLEVGTLGGYSAIWMGRGLPANGTLLTVERDPDHAALARSYIDRAGLSARVRVKLGDAREVLPDLSTDPPWDAVFLDADKEGYPTYAREALRLLRPGGLLLADNALWKGRVLASPETPADRGILRFNELIANDPSLTATILPVGDGLAVAVVTG